jgi:hypothetical protein
MGTTVSLMQLGAEADDLPAYEEQFQAASAVQR